MLNDSDPVLPSSGSALQGETIRAFDAVSAFQSGDSVVCTMEQAGNTGPLESEPNTDNMENSSPASVLDDKGDQSNEEEQKSVKPTSKEFRKTWGFRRTTIAKREGAGEADVDSSEQQPQQQQGINLRRSGRQPKRTERVEEFLTTVRRRGRRSVPTTLEDSSEAASGPATDAETASEDSVESTPDTKPVTRRICTRSCKEQKSPKSRPAKEEEEEEEEEDEEEDATSDSDSDGLTLKELQNRLRKKRVEQKSPQLVLKDVQNHLRKRNSEQDPAKTGDVTPEKQDECELPVKQEPDTADSTEIASQVVVSEEDTEDLEAQKEEKGTKGASDEEPEEQPKSKPESEIYDPNALYCICRQPHNNRFMICCDRCEEWFHGDCVGISEARGRLLERNGEDYICPNCTILQGQDEPVSELDQQEAKMEPGNVDGTECTSIGTIEQKSVEDQGIKGRIEKAANPSGKKKLKIFQPVVEAPGASKCIGPGCFNVAQPDSVYCSNDCILKHAAATMKILSSGKDAKPKPKEKIKPKSEKPGIPKPQQQVSIKPVSNQKRQLPEKREVNVKKSVVSTAKAEVNSPAPAREPAAEPVTPSWASDHNYNAVKPERTAAISPALLFKCMYGLGIFLNNHIFFEYPSILGSEKLGSFKIWGFFSYYGTELLFSTFKDSLTDTHK